MNTLGFKSGWAISNVVGTICSPCLELNSKILTFWNNLNNGNNFFHKIQIIIIVSFVWHLAYCKPAYNCLSFLFCFEFWSFSAGILITCKMAEKSHDLLSIPIFTWTLIETSLRTLQRILLKWIHYTRFAQKCCMARK